MTTYELDKAAARLKAMRERRRTRLMTATAALCLAAGALLYSDPLAISFLVGVGCALALALADTYRRRELLAGLALDRQAYALPEVRRYGAGLVMLSGRQRVAAALERVLENAGTPGSCYLSQRVDAFRGDIAGLASAVRAPDARVEPTSIARCWRLLTRAAESPLYNHRIPADDLGFELQRIYAGIRPTGRN
jgi:hypothetical protein